MDINLYYPIQIKLNKLNLKYGYSYIFNGEHWFFKISSK